MNLNYYNSTKIVSGIDCLKNYNEIADFGKNCFVVTGKSSAKKSGALDDVIQLLIKNNINYRVFDEIEQNPVIDTCFRGGKFAFEMKADFILGIGGGSPLDAAKAIAIYAANPQMKDKMEIYVSGFNDAIPVLAINTTVGTGSEVTPYSVLTVNEIHNKKSVGHSSIFPRVAFLDPNYVKSLPKRVMASTAIDALSHVMEGYLSKKATIITDIFAEKAFDKICTGLRQFANNDISEEVYENLLYGSTLGGMVIAHTGTCFVHSMGYPLTYHHGVSHGEANAYFLTEFVNQMEKEDSKRVQKMLGCCGMNEVTEIQKLIDSVLNLRIKLTEEQCKKYTETVFESKNINNSIKTLNSDEIEAIYKKIML